MRMLLIVLVEHRLHHEGFEHRPQRASRERRGRRRDVKLGYRDGGRVSSSRWL
jgi:hypothetical protein